MNKINKGVINTKEATVINVGNSKLTIKNNLITFESENVHLDNQPKHKGDDD